MSAYNIEKNTDDVTIRYIVVALLAELRDKIYFYDLYEDGKKKVNVPFYFSMSGNEDFLIENFLNDNVKDPTNKKAIGNYDVVPRGVLSLQSISIDNGALTHKFIRTQLVKEISGKLKTFSFETQIVQLVMSFDVSIQCNSALERFKITQSLISKLYKNNLFEIDMGGYRVSGNFSLPEDLDQEQLIEFSFNDRKEYKINFSIEVKSFMPVFEHGLLMGDIEDFIEYLIENSDKSEDEILRGVGVFRGGENNKLGIYFGNIIEQFRYGTDDMLRAPYNDRFSNERYNEDSDSSGLFPSGPSSDEREIKED
jgi:hypothetical protein